MTHARHGMASAGSVAALIIATGLVYALKPIAPILSLGVLYVPAVLAAAALFGVGYAIVVALASMILFNFLFLPPVHTLSLADSRNWAALAVFVVSAVITSQLAAHARARAAVAERREQEAELLSDAAAALLQEASLDEIRSRADIVLANSDEMAKRRFDAAIDSLLAVSEQRRESEAVRRSDAIKTVILQTVSHDFRTPLATMRAAVDGLQDPSFQLSDEDRAELLETIRLETARLGRLVENVLDLSRIEAGVAAPQPAIWPVEDLLRQAAAETSDPARVQIDVSHALPAARVDAVQIQRVIVNLVENALKFSTDEVELRSSEEDGRVVVEVLDRGPGMDGTASSQRGLGLGLAIAHGFTIANEGTLSLEARSGGGTRARLALPAESVPIEVTR